MNRYIRFFAALMILLTAVSFSALADTVLPISSSGFTVVLPSGFQEDELTEEDLDEGMVGFYELGDMLLAIYDDAASGSTLTDIAAGLAQDETVSHSGLTTINGQSFVYYVFQQDELLVIDYLFMVNDRELYLAFSMPDASYSQQAADIMNSLSQSTAGTVQPAADLTGGIQVGQTSLYMALEDFEPEQLTASDREDGMTAYWDNDRMAVAVYEFDTDGSTLQEMADAFAEEGYDVTGPTTINGLETFLFSYTDEEDGEETSVIVLITETGDCFLEIAVFVDDPSLLQQAGDLLMTLHP